MPKFIIGRSYGYAGTSSEDEIEADSLEDAENMAWEFALENVESWAKEAEDQEDE
ncbi:hypothetical protein PXK01_19450 [Phaeobacter sp. PT47_59]|uniref:hypothetical protein n=1 Tax=Phaeobacter sp. PT47_59 TaxID=3029979 RepID=UPI0023809D57|nr:hypothetical protein [Phaeobacter sp. PT47_59]MDE4176337.1 hypothetical protein [Phaeobacter sp. PT47_59]